MLMPWAVPHAALEVEAVWPSKLFTYVGLIWIGIIVIMIAPRREFGRCGSGGVMIEVAGIVVGIDLSVFQLAL
jgi:hypothetical protein